ncbi:ABC transporter G family member 39-like [Macadamia integrifolia]|uniref:ABC transporter G family member 39-like n=1 Tax=Macadamia integrifolia TaxID=60698 RepID=UPI001C4EFCBD|nr:ABC transporter G family member 39-like [Macadamia integrifolia]
MNTEDIYRVASIHRSQSRSGFWRSSSNNVFSQSTRNRDDVDDEEGLKWAALERLPTFDRIKKAIVTGTDGEKKEVDVQNLEIQEKKNLVNRLVRIAEEDNENFLFKLKNRMQQVGIEVPTIEVRFEHLNIGAQAYIGSRGLPSMLNFCLNIVEESLTSLYILQSRKKPFPILQDVHGIIKPSRMTLLLGPPGSGKTTLLLALAGKLDSKLKVSGNITYNGHGMKEFVPQRTSAYVSQHDLHIAEMTVRETLAFSARCQGVGTRYEMLTEMLRREKAANIKPDPDIDAFMKAASQEGQKENVVVDYILKILGLEVCADTMVGNDMIRGISGGQRKRVTTGEMVVGPAKALFMDEISTGLDSSTTYQIVNSLRQATHILGVTTVIALLQPAPETYDLFDDIILLSEGQIVYEGPQNNILEFFESLGFKCPERKGVADFLQEVTSIKDQQQYWAHKDEPYTYVSVKDFADAFKSFHIGQKLGEELSTPFNKRKSHPAALATSKYGISKKELLKSCFSREWLLMKRNSFIFAFRVMRVTLVGSITMTVFLRTKMKRDTIIDGRLFMGVLFFILNTTLINGFPELAMTLAKLPVFYKQRDLLFYPSWAYALPTWMLKIPMSFLESAIWVGMAYYVIGFDPNIHRMFKQYLILILVSQVASSMFRLVAALARDMVVSYTFGTFVLLMFGTLGGFILSRDDVKKWWIWGYWSSPMTYAQNALNVNEFLGHSWSHSLPYSTEPLGIEVLKSAGSFTSSSVFWIGTGALIGYILLFNAAFTLALGYLNQRGKSQTIISEEALKEKHVNKTGEIDNIELSYRGKRSSNQSTESQSGNEIERSSISSRSNRKEAPAESSQKNKGMILPFTPLAITFDDIKYSVDMPKEMKAQGVQEERLVLLNGVSGSFRPGVLTALMGVSGAGKTTLMDVLAGRKTSGYIEGNITISGYPKKNETFARVSGYCEQNDIHSPCVTVHEALVYSAWLRLSTEVDSRTRKIFIEDVMELVELTSHRVALVGLPGVNGLSTEQRKRLTIAVELVANPSVIFMDEPTSGLDARAAAIVMRTVRNTVDTGRTVVCTIHQPSIDIFEAFDELFLMQRGGVEIYVGPLGHHSCQLIKYFEGICGVPKIKDGYNPATWMLEVTSPAQEETLGIKFAETYKNSDLFWRNKALITELSTAPPGSKDLYFPTQFSQPLFTQCVACLWKQHKSYWRNPAYTSVRLLSTTVIALMFGTLFWDLGSKTTKLQDLFNAMGSMYIAVLFTGIQNASAVQPVVAVERTVFYREKAAGMYSALPYALAQVLIEVPHIFIQALIYGVLVYAMIGFDWTVHKFFCYFFYMYLSFLYFTYYGMMAVGLTPNHDIAAIVSSAFYALWNLFGGFLIPPKRLPVWWRWYHWACPVSWTLNGLIASQFGDNEEQMDIGYRVKDFLDEYFGYKHDFLGWIFIALVGYVVLFALVFAIAIKVLNFQRR